jgi:hypothetical protein
MPATRETNSRLGSHKVENSYLESEMCVECLKEEQQIAQYQQLARTIMDQRTLDQIAHQIMELRSAKAERHPAREE